MGTRPLFQYLICHCGPLGPFCLGLLWHPLRGRIRVNSWGRSCTRVTPQKILLGPHLHFPGDRHLPAFPGLCRLDVVSHGCIFEPLASRPPVRVFCFFIDCRILCPCSVRVLSFTGIANASSLLSSFPFVCALFSETQFIGNFLCDWSCLGTCCQRTRFSSVLKA